MELVYLWVKEYKNIHKQGFNFSPRFHCEYDPDTNELTIDENKDYIPDFFGENINVTAIVGKNGSGKSSVLELLLILAFKAKDYIFDNQYGLWCIVFDRKISKFGILTFSESNFSFSKINTLCNINIEDRYIKQVSGTSFFTIHYNLSFEQYSSSFVNLISRYLQTYHGSLYDFDSKSLNTSNAFSFPNKKYNKIDLDKMDNVAVLLMFRTLNANNKIREYFNNLFKNNKLNFIPSSVTVQLDKDNLKQVFGNASIAENTVSKVKDLRLENLYILFINIIMSYWNIDTTPKNLQHYFLDDASPILSFIRYKYDELLRKYTRVTIGELVEAVNDDMINLVAIFKDSTLLKQLKQSESLNTSVYNLAELIDSIRLNKYDNDVFMNSITNSDIILHTLPYLPEFVQVDVKSTYNVKFSDFSRGEKHIITFIYSLIYYFPYYDRNTSVNVINILIDEIESGLNPFWQQKIVTIVHKIISFLELNNIMINIVVTTHSPFLLSDIPKQNIIFLNTYKEDDKEVQNEEQKAGNCKVVDGLHDKQETFGQNIHTLLSDSFFMEDGLMGEFAKSKINEIIRFHNITKKNKHKTCLKKIYDKREEKFRQIQSIVGDPYLQQVLENHLLEIDKFFDKKVAKAKLKARLEKQLAELEDD